MQRCCVFKLYICFLLSVFVLTCVLEGTIFSCLIIVLRCVKDPLSFYIKVYLLVWLYTSANDSGYYRPGTLYITFNVLSVTSLLQTTRLDLTRTFISDAHALFSMSIMPRVLWSTLSSLRLSDPTRHSFSIPPLIRPSFIESPDVDITAHLTVHCRNYLVPTQTTK